MSTADRLGSRAAIRPARSVTRAITAAAAMVLLASYAQPALAQGRQQQPSHGNWTLADRFANDKLRPFVYSSSVSPNWINETDSLWYSWEDNTGTQFNLLVPKTRTKRPLFDHMRMAALLSQALKKPVESNKLPITRLSFRKDGHTIRFSADSAARFDYDLNAGTLRKLADDERDPDEPPATQGRRGGGGGGFGRGGGRGDFRNYSPDSTAFAFAREHNLYIVEVGKPAKTNPDTLQISTDGEKDYSFGARDTTDTQQDDELDNENEGQGGRGGRGRDPRVRANVTWSPDSKALVVTRNDQRKVGELYLVDVLAEPRPVLKSYRYAMPGEENVAQQEMYAYRRGETAIKPVDVSKWKDQRLFDLHWTTGSDKVRLVRRDRLQRNLELIEVDLATGAKTSLLTESVENAYLERQNARYVKAGTDMIWWSERTGWGQYYLYDHNGKLKNAITNGAWRAENIVAVDSVKRVLWFSAVGREPGENPYYRHTYRVNLDGSGLALVDAGDGSHNTSVSPSFHYALDTYSRIDMPPKAVLRDETGKVLMDLETMDVSKLEDYGWRAPETFTVKAADGVTDIYGDMWKPFDFDSTKSYPIIAHVYPGPQTESVTYTFSPTASPQALAQLGFIVIQIGNRGGSPQRSNAYHSFGYYNLRDYALADKKAGIEQLAARHPWIDIQRVGIFGHSGGGFLTAAALMLPPYNDFFKVGVSSSGNHDNNVYNQNWSEQHHGLKEVPVKKNDVAQDGAAGGQARNRSNGRGGNDGNDGDAQQQGETKFEIKVPTNAELAENLKGNLLLVHGDMDNNVHPAGTIRLMNALIKANKRFDFMVMPGKPHGYGDMQPYFNHMMYEYFAEHLLGDYYRTGADMNAHND